MSTFPGIVNLAGWYDDLVRWTKSGFILEEQGQGAPHFMEKFLTALEHEKIAADLRLSETTVKRALRELEKNGYVQRVQRKRDNGGWTSNLYLLK